ncbi:MAG: hypothetical protein OJF55_002429 [Rhodanobacteraceae bacterium]|nr:MAG: hypothetical protein OJF55_002429 [Rhodanobacteraceae bacterium]
MSRRAQARGDIGIRFPVTRVFAIIPDRGVARRAYAGTGLGSVAPERP